MIAPQSQFYRELETEVWVLFGFRVPGTGGRIRREAYCWKSCASIQRLDRHHAVMTIRPGGAKEIAR